MVQIYKSSALSKWLVMLTLLTTAEYSDAEYYQYTIDSVERHNVLRTVEDNEAKHLFCVKSSDPFEKMVFLENLLQLETINASTCGIQQINYDLHYTSTSRKTSIFLEKLHTLDLSHNNISFIQNHCFYNLRYGLKTLNLSNNVITNMETKAFYDLVTLELLDLSNNQITFIDETSFKDLTNLQNFSLVNNKLQILNFNLFSKSKNLRFLNFNTNNISIINTSSKTWNNMIALDLGNNNVGNSVYNNLAVIKQFPNLMILELSEKNINPVFVTEKCENYFILIIVLLTSSSLIWCLNIFLNTNIVRRFSKDE